jgi:hypothetical protein
MSLCKVNVLKWISLTGAFSVLASALIVSGGCTTAPVASERDSSDHVIRHTLREVAEYDSPKMISIVNKEFAPGSNGEQYFFNRASIILGQTVLVQPHFTEREASIREFKSKFEQSEFLGLLPQTADELISLSLSSNPADQASALYALTNLVIEVRSAYKLEKDFREELHNLLVHLRDAKLHVSDQAKRYAHEQIADLVSPSDEAAEALKMLEATKG